MVACDVFTGCMDNSIRVWNAATFHCLAVLTGHTRGVVTLFSPEPERKQPILLIENYRFYVLLWCCSALSEASVSVFVIA